MTDPRPRPQYGEYATPEEQAKAMGIGAPAPTEVASPEADASAPVVPVADAAHQRPAYGENAPAGSAPFVPPTTPGTEVAAPAAFTASTAAPVVAQSSGSGPASSAATAPRPRRRWDVILTAVLLGMGVVSVVSSIPQYADFGATMQAGISQLGYGEYTAVALANTIGIAINVSQIVLYLITAFIAIRVVQRGRLGFYIPLIGAFVSGVVTVALLIVAITGDPALLTQITSGA